MEKGGCPCQVNPSDLALTLAAPSLRMVGSARNMKRKRLGATKSTTETLPFAAAMAVPGSDRYVAAHPLCEECKKQGKLTPTEEVHHILPLSKGGTHAESNLMALCKSCHSAITARDGDRWRPGGGS